MLRETRASGATQLKGNFSRPANIPLGAPNLVIGNRYCELATKDVRDVNPVLRMMF